MRDFLAIVNMSSFRNLWFVPHTPFFFSENMCKYDTCCHVYQSHVLLLANIACAQLQSDHCIVFGHHWLKLTASELVKKLSFVHILPIDCMFTLYLAYNSEFKCSILPFCGRFCGYSFIQNRSIFPYNNGRYIEYSIYRTFDFWPQNHSIYRPSRYIDPTLNIIIIIINK